MNGPYKYYKTGPPDHDLTALVIQSPEPPSRPSEVLRTSKTAQREIEGKQKLGFESRI